MKKHIVQNLFLLVTKSVFVLILFLGKAGILYSQDPQDSQDSIPVIPIDQTPIEVLMNKPQLDTCLIKLNNINGKSDLIYQISVDYKRSPDTARVPETSLRQIRVEEPFNRVIQYEDPVLLSSAYGSSSGNSGLTVATKYNGGYHGFNVSDVGAWFFCGNIKEGVIQAEIRAGGASIHDAVSLGRGILRYKTEENEINGKYYNVTLDSPVSIYPDEDFYVIFTFSAAVARPLGCAVNEKVETVSGRYWVYEQEEWKDLQQKDGFTTGSWLMYVAEKAEKKSDWLKIISTPSDTLSAGDSTFVKIQLVGSRAKLGSQYANIVFKSNDSINPILKVPVTLRINEAPYFIDAPLEISIMEDSVKVFEIGLIDYEDNAFTLEPLIGCKVASYIVENSSKLILTVAPQLGDTGKYQVKYRVTDQFGASRELMIPIEVTVIPPPPPSTCVNPTGIIVQKWNKVLLVDNSFGEFNKEGFQWYKNSIPIKNATGQYYSSEDDTGGLLDLSAEYHVRLVTNTGDTLYTCPLRINEPESSLRAYPNPVLKSGTLNIVATSVDEIKSPQGIIQIISSSGQIMETIVTDRMDASVTMPSKPGVYFVKVSVGNQKQVFTVKVE